MSETPHPDPAPDQPAVALSRGGLRRRRCVNVCLNGCKSLWIKARKPQCKCECKTLFLHGSDKQDQQRLLNSIDLLGLVEETRCSIMTGFVGAVKGERNDSVRLLRKNADRHY